MGSKYTKVFTFFDKQNIKGLYKDDKENYFWRYNEDYSPVNITCYIDKKSNYYEKHKWIYNEDKWKDLPSNINPTYKLYLPDFGGDNYILNNNIKQSKDTIVFQIEILGINSTVIFVSINDY